MKNLRNKGVDKFKITQYWTPIDTLDLMIRKQVYPYSYINSFEKFQEKMLPPKEAFFNDLTRKHISDEDYRHTKLVWKTFNMKTLGNFHDIYLCYDVLLLADVIEYLENCLFNTMA